MSLRKRILDVFVPRATRRSITRRWKLMMARPRIGSVDFGDLRRTRPICRDWGYTRGTPIDRYYIARFLERHAADVRGDVLEIGTNAMTLQYGGDRVRRSEVLHVSDSTPPITMIGDLTRPESLPEDSFDCIILTQTLHFIYDIRQVVRSLHRMLRPGGVVLVTVPGISKISPEDRNRWGQYWAFTAMSARLLFEEVFPAEAVQVDPAGNVLAAAAFLYGIAAEELSPAELDDTDEFFETLLGIRAHRPL